MTRLVWLALAATLVATGCGRGGGGTVPVAIAPTPAAKIRAVDLASTSTGALLTARAVAPTQGYWNAALVPQESDLPGRLAFTFAATPPPGPAPVLTERSREIAVATYLSLRELAGVDQITVQGADSTHAVNF
ncbi:hypothetical protein [Palleronia sp.]|uniref:hypothetical protein n=1 Tax=Palleronia sp. TaxID=1940284 RepID=UPI0035C85FAF